MKNEKYLMVCRLKKRVIVKILAIVNMGQQIGVDGEKFIKIVFSTAGKIITSYPVK